MKAIKTEIPGVVLLEPEVFGDARGYFMERFSQRRFDELVGPVRFVQDNESKSRYGVVRGLHFQKGEYAQAKLVSVVRGRVLDVAVDIRRGSPPPPGTTNAASAPAARRNSRPRPPARPTRCWTKAKSKRRSGWKSPTGGSRCSTV